MKFKTGLLLGFGIGYVLGTRAGRERYEQIRQGWDRFSGSPAVQRTAERTKEVAEEQAKRTLHAVEQGVEKAGSAVKDRLKKDEGAEAVAESWPGTPDQLPPPEPPKSGELGT